MIPSEFAAVYLVETPAALLWAEGNLSDYALVTRHLTRHPPFSLFVADLPKRWALRSLVAYLRLYPDADHILYCTSNPSLVRLAVEYGGRLAHVEKRDPAYGRFISSMQDTRLFLSQYQNQQLTPIP